MAFLADENVPRPIVERLRRDGFAIAETNPGAVDADILAHAEQRDLLLITQDHDFGELAILRGMRVPGIVLLELERLPLSAQVERVANVIAADYANLSGHLTVIEPGRTRVRKLPKP